MAKLKLIIDTREQKPLKFKKDSFDEESIECLKFGDYGVEIDGQLVPIVFERKSLGDLFGTMTKGYERFKRELERAREANAILILLVEGSLEDIYKGIPYSKFKGSSMLKKLAMMRVRYDLEWHCFNSRREMARFIEEIFGAVKRNYKMSEETEKALDMEFFLDLINKLKTGSPLTVTAKFRLALLLEEEVKRLKKKRTRKDGK